LAFVPASEKAHPLGVVLDVPELANILKFSLTGEPRVVKLIVPAACAPCIGTAISIKANIVKIEKTFENVLVMFVLLKQKTI
jgi:hypothetical protein